jgi:competence protein ComEA
MPTVSLSRRRALVVVACAIGVVLAATRVVGAPGSSPRAAPLTPVLAPPATSAPARKAVVVDVVGAVRRPGLYRLGSGARVADAIARAGGVTGRADRSLVNLAAPLADGQQVVVPRAGTGLAPPAGGPAPSPSAPVNLNSATVEQLDGLPGVGPVTAQKIVDYRREHGPFTSVDQLDAISGIGPTRIDNLRAHVTS